MDGPAESSSSSAASASTAAPHLRRVLGLKDLVFYGIVLIQPIGAVGIFGLANKNSLGHVSATIVLALVAMMLTAASYGRMAGLYPVAGSAYTYVGRGLNPHLGFLAGWAMFLDYLVIPIVSLIFGAESMQQFIDTLAPGSTSRLLSHFAYSGDPARAGMVFWVVVFTLGVTLLNLRGIKWTANVNLILTAVMFAVIALFVFDAVSFLVHHQGARGLFSFKPFYDPKTFRIGPVATATSLAALTYIGFDGITTLAEDVREPKRTVPLAIVSVCLIIGLCAVVEMYLAQRVWPDYNAFKNLDTAFFDVCGLVGGRLLFNVMTLTMIVACLGTALTGQVGAARILFGMGRDGALPKFFARLNGRNNPVFNIWLIGILVLIGSLVLKYETSADLVNFGAFLAFMGVNAAVIREFMFRPPAGHRRNPLVDLIVPGLGFAFCAMLWWQLPALAQKVGGCWCGVGIIYTAIKTRGFTRPPVMLDLSGS